jgi:hypothetical protein
MDNSRSPRLSTQANSVQTVRPAGIWNGSILMRQFNCCMNKGGHNDDNHDDEAVDEERGVRIPRVAASRGNQVMNHTVTTFP